MDQEQVNSYLPVITQTAQGVQIFLLLCILVALIIQQRQLNQLESKVTKLIGD